MQVLGLAEASARPTSTLDDFTSLLGLNDARMLVDLLKLAVAKRVGPNAKETISNVLTGKSNIDVNFITALGSRPSLL